MTLADRIRGYFHEVNIATKQIKETRRATYATAFKSIYDLLQNDEIRKARAYVFDHLCNQKFESWINDDKKIAEKVCHSYDSVAIMIKNGMLPLEIIADSWGDFLRRSWKIEGSIEPI